VSLTEISTTYPDSGSALPKILARDNAQLRLPSQWRWMALEEEVQQNLLQLLGIHPKHG